MRMKTLSSCFLLLILLVSVFSLQNHGSHGRSSTVIFANMSDEAFNPRVVLPVYVRLQALEKSNVTVWESVPRNFTDHVASIESRVLAMFIPTNSLGFNLSTDDVGNLWMFGNYSLDAEEYVSTLMWVSSRTTNENLTDLRGSLSWPTIYPDDAKVYLEPGRKIQVQNQTIQEIAGLYHPPQISNMTEAVKEVLDYVNTQNYDPAKTRLLLSGNLTTTDMLDVFKDALRVHDTNTSICLERSWYAAAILRAAGVPTRTVSDVRLKTWIQVWLPSLGWVDGETLCSDAFPHRGMLPKPLTTSVPWLIQNSSDAIFPVTWTPSVQMKVVNLTFSSFTAVRLGDYGTVVSEPIDETLFKTDYTKFRFPIVFKENSEIHAALTRQGQQLNFSLFEVIRTKDGTEEAENVTKAVTFGQPFSIALGNTLVSFDATNYGRFVVLRNFGVQEIWSFDTRLLIPIIAVPVALVAVWLFMKRRRSRG